MAGRLEHSERLRQLSNPPWRGKPATFSGCRFAHDNTAIGLGAQTWPWVVQAAIGISSQWIVAGHGVRLAVMRVWRTREFDQQIGRHAFGSIALSIEF